MTSQREVLWRWLDLSKLDLVSLDGVADVISVDAHHGHVIDGLDLSQNPLKDLRGLPTIQHLKMLDLSSTLITTFNGVCPQVGLAHLILKPGCPLVSHPKHRILARMAFGPSLTIVDGAELTPEELQTADSLGPSACMCVRFGLMSLNIADPEFYQRNLLPTLRLRFETEPPVQSHSFRDNCRGLPTEWFQSRFRVRGVTDAPKFVPPTQDSWALSSFLKKHPQSRKEAQVQSTSGVSSEASPTVSLSLSRASVATVAGLHVVVEGLVMELEETPRRCTLRVDLSSRLLIWHSELIQPATFFKQRREDVADVRLVQRGVCVGIEILGELGRSSIFVVSSNESNPRVVFDILLLWMAL